MIRFFYGLCQVCNEAIKSVPAARSPIVLLYASFHQIPELVRSEKGAMLQLSTVRSQLFQLLTPSELGNQTRLTGPPRSSPSPQHCLLLSWEGNRIFNDLHG